MVRVTVFNKVDPSSLHQRCNVFWGGRDIDKTTALATELAHNINGGSISAVAVASDVLILAIPLPAVEEVLQATRDLTDKVLVDITNPLTEDFQGLLLGHSTSAAEAIQESATDAKVVKAFNTIFEQLLPLENRSQATVQTLIASDNNDAKATVIQLAGDPSTA